MKLVLVTGLSGSGKTQVLRALEDIGFYCVDNLPPQMLSSFVDICEKQGGISEACVVIDTRGGVFLHGIAEALDELTDRGVDLDIVYLDASDMVLLQRFKETRRVHPLEKVMSIDSAITTEREVLAPLRERANIIIDTTSMRTKELWATILSRYREESAQGPVGLSVISFGYKNGLPPEADLIFDARFLPNPFYIPHLKALSGLDDAVYEYVCSFPETMAFLDKLSELCELMIPMYVREGNKYPTIAIGCTGGRHRSVSIARALAGKLTQDGYSVDVRHKDIEKDLQR